MNGNSTNDQVEINHPKSLVAMPDHVLEKIFHSLNFEDQLSFAESSVRLNQIFNASKNLCNLWFKIPNYQQASEISRPYENLIWDCREVKMPTSRRWSNFVPSMTSLRFDNAENLQNLAPTSLLDALPHFKNLSHLDIVVSESLVTKLLGTRRRKKVKIIEMENLGYLRMDIKLFNVLDGRYINFSSTKKLRELIITKVTNNRRFSVLSEDLEDASKLRALIEAQTNLGTLHLMGEAAISIFRTPLNIISCHMEEFKLVVKCCFDFPINCQENICDFISSLNQLKHLECKFDGVLERTRKIDNFFSERLKSSSRTQEMVFLEDAFWNLWGFRSPDGIFESQVYVAQSLVLETDQHPNLWTEKLILKINVSHPRIGQIIPFIVIRFPNLSSIDINSQVHTENAQTDCFQALGSLQHLESFALHHFASTFLKSIDIPDLKHFDYTDNDETVSNDNGEKVEDLIDFLNRHGNIQELSFSLSGSISQKLIMKTVEYALENLKNLMSLSLTMRDEATLSKANLEILMYLSCFSLNDDFSSFNSHQFFYWERTFQLIIQNAKLGFRFKCSSVEIMKRFDNKIVQKVKGKWQLIET